MAAILWLSLWCWRFLRKHLLSDSGLGLTISNEGKVKMASKALHYTLEGEFCNQREHQEHFVYVDSRKDVSSVLLPRLHDWMWWGGGGLLSLKHLTLATATSE